MKSYLSNNVSRIMNNNFVVYALTYKTIIGQNEEKICIVKQKHENSNRFCYDYLHKHTAIISSTLEGKQNQINNVIKCYIVLLKYLFTGGKSF